MSPSRKNEYEEENDYQPLSTGFVAVLYGKAAFNFLACFACFFFVAAMLSKRTIRNNAYNLYVIFMILPDGINNFFRVLMNLFIAINHGVRWFPPGYFYVDLFFWMFYYVSNFYINALVTYEIHKLLRYSHQRKRASPPLIPKVLKQVSAVYLFAAFMSLTMVAPVPFAIYHITNERRGEGAFGSPSPGGWFNFGVATSIGVALFAIPTFYALIVGIIIWKKKLLPKSGRTRALSLFFLRVIIIFVLFYFPNVLLTHQRQGMEDDSAGAFWIDTILGILTACQALTTLYMIWLKDDIREAVNHVWNYTFGRICCACCLCSGNSQDETAHDSTEIHISGLSRPETKGSSEVHLSRLSHPGEAHSPTAKASRQVNNINGLSQPVGKKIGELADCTSVELSPSKKSRGSSHLLFVKQFQDAWTSDDDVRPLDTSEKLLVDSEQPDHLENEGHPITIR